MSSSDPQLRLSIVIVCYEMAAQIANTLRTLVPPYQRGIALNDYEIILIDNGSREPLPEATRELSRNLRYIYVPPAEAKASPAEAINRAAAMARAPVLCLMIDGARMLTPGVLSWALRLLGASTNAIAEVRGWHLGTKSQPESVAAGYDHAAETRLLNTVAWQENGYRLFEISAASAQTRAGLSKPAAESNCLFVSRALFDQLGGFDERYRAPGGGLVNLDFYARAVSAAECVWTILGEGTFHQVHGGTATNLSLEKFPAAWDRWYAESLAIRGPLPTITAEKFILAGHVPKEFERWLAPVPAT